MRVERSCCWHFNDEKKRGIQIRCEWENQLWWREEEIENRYKYDIEQLVADFEDEEFIERKIIAESSDEKEEELDARDRRHKIR